MLRWLAMTLATFRGFARRVILGPGRNLWAVSGASVPHPMLRQAYIRHALKALILPSRSLSWFATQENVVGRATVNI